jgi:glycosyltransferase involved in cell wall biosynthesis
MTESVVAPRLSIIVATWNAARAFERCVASIEEQTFTDWELLVPDGGSTDGTVDLIRKHERSIAWWQSGRDGGIYDAWNQAIGRARGEYVCFLGADDAWADKNALADLFAATGGRGYDLVTSRAWVEDPVSKKTWEFGSAWDFRRIGRKMVVCHPGLLHSRALFEKYGLFDTRFRITGDLDFLLRLPEDLATLHVDAITVRVELGGISRKNVLARLREQRIALSRCARYGPVRARLVWMDKLLRYPMARLIGIPH